MTSDELKTLTALITRLTDTVGEIKEDVGGLKADSKSAQRQRALLFEQHTQLNTIVTEVSTTLKGHADHENRIEALEQFKTRIMTTVSLVSGAVGTGVAGLIWLTNWIKDHIMMTGGSQ